MITLVVTDCPALEVIRESAMDGVVLQWCAMVELMVANVVLAKGLTSLHHQILLLWSVSLCCILRIAMLHHQDTLPTCWWGMVGKPWWLRVHHDWRHKSPSISSNGRIPHTQVAVATVDTTMHTPLLRATVVVTDALGRGVTELVELLQILSHGGIGQVNGRHSV